MSDNKNFDDSQLNEIWEAVGTYKPNFEPDVEKGLARFKNKLQEAEPYQVKEATVVPMYRILMRAAAAFALLAVVAFAVNQFVTTSMELVTIVASNEMKEVNLPDGSKVWLNQDAQLSYAPEFKGDIRELQLKGEAFFDVARDENKPFIIQAGQGSVTVLGTSFLVNTSAKETEVLVKSGKVAYQATAEQEPVLLTKNMKATYTVNTAVPTISQNVSLNELAWQSKVLQFRGVALSTILKEVAEAYKVTIRLENKNLADCSYTDRIRTDESSAVEALANLLSLVEMKHREDNGTIYLSGGKTTCK